MHETAEYVSTATYFVIFKKKSIAIVLGSSHIFTHYIGECNSI